jgi:hypothetical protein
MRGELHFAEAIHVPQVFLEVLHLLQLLGLVTTEERVTGCGLKQDQHSIIILSNILSNNEYLLEHSQNMFLRGKQF